MVRCGGAAHAVELVDVSGGGMCVGFAQGAAPAPDLGDIVEVEIRAEGLCAPLPAATAVVRVERDAGWLVLGLCFLDWMGLVAGLPKPLAAVFNLRRDPRLPMDPARPVAIALRGADGAFDLEGVLLDLSAGGASVAVDLAAQCHLRRVDDVVVRFELPGVDRTFTLQAVIRHRSWCGEALRLGLCFDTDASADVALQVASVQSYVERRLDQTLQQIADGP